MHYTRSAAWNGRVTRMSDEAVFFAGGRVANAILEILALLPPQIRPAVAAAVLAHTTVAVGLNSEQVLRLVEQALEDLRERTRAEGH